MALEYRVLEFDGAEKGSFNDKVFVNPSWMQGMLNKESCKGWRFLRIENLSVDPKEIALAAVFVREQTKEMTPMEKQVEKHLGFDPDSA